MLNRLDLTNSDPLFICWLSALLQSVANSKNMFKKNPNKTSTVSITSSS